VVYEFDEKASYQCFSSKTPGSRRRSLPLRCPGIAGILFFRTTQNPFTEKDNIMTNEHNNMTPIDLLKQYRRSQRLHLTTIIVAVAMLCLVLVYVATDTNNTNSHINIQNIRAAEHMVYAEFAAKEQLAQIKGVNEQVMTEITVLKEELAELKRQLREKNGEQIHVSSLIPEFGPLPP
jgi:cell division protein FtsL